MNQVVSKKIGQLRYQPTLNYVNHMFSAASTVEGTEGFKEWSVQRNSETIQLFSIDEHYGLTVSPDSLLLSSENTSMSKQLFKKLSEYSTLFIEPYEISLFKHAGIRQISIFDIDGSYDSYAQKFFSKYNGDDNIIKNISVDTVKDTYFVIEGIRDGYSVRVQIAPLKKDQLQKSFPFDDFTPKDLVLKKDVNVLIDLDVYSTLDADYDIAIENLKSVDELHAEIFEELVAELRTLR